MGQDGRSPRLGQAMPAPCCQDQVVHPARHHRHQFRAIGRLRREIYYNAVQLGMFAMNLKFIWQMSASSNRWIYAS